MLEPVNRTAAAMILPTFGSRRRGGEGRLRDCLHSNSKQFLQADSQPVIIVATKPVADLNPLLIPRSRFWNGLSGCEQCAGVDPLQLMIEMQRTHAMRSAGAMVATRALWPDRDVYIQGDCTSAPRSTWLHQPGLPVQPLLQSVRSQPRNTFQRLTEARTGLLHCVPARDETSPNGSRSHR